MQLHNGFGSVFKLSDNHMTPYLLWVCQVFCVSFKKKFMGRGTSPYASPVTLSNYCTKALWPNRFSCTELLPLIFKIHHFHIYGFVLGFFHPYPTDFGQEPSYLVAVHSTFCIIQLCVNTTA